MDIKKENKELVLRIPLTQKNYDAIGEYIGDVPNLVGYSDGRDFSINYLIALGYKDDIQLGMPVISFVDFKELKGACELLGLSIWEFGRCSKCGDPLIGSFTMGDDGKNICYSCSFEDN
jgi:hypothetical protein